MVPGSTPRVSVCLPVYNGGAFLGPAVASVLGQTFPDFELRICDDASTDGSWERVQALEDPRVVRMRNPRNLGPEANWNRSLEGARGDCIKLFHQDDLLEPDCLGRQLAALDAEPGAALAFCRRRILSPAGKVLMTRGPRWRPGPVTLRQVFRACLGSGSNPIGEPSAVLFRRRAAQAAGAFDGREPYLIDLDYWFRLMDHGCAVYLDQPLASFRQWGGQWSAVIGQRQSRQFRVFIRRMAAERFPETPRVLLGWSGLMAERNQLLRGVIARWAGRR